MKNFSTPNSKSKKKTSPLQTQAKKNVCSNISRIHVRNHVNPIIVPWTGGSDPVCAVGNRGFRIEVPIAGNYNIDNFFDLLIVSADGITFDWSASKPGITSITVKGGANQNIYNYVNHEIADSGLKAPPNGPVLPFIDHIDICYNPETVLLFGLQVSKTADTRFNRTWIWNITKTADKTALELSAGQTYNVAYNVFVTESYVDSNFEVYGDITIRNTNDATGEDIVINNVADLVSPAAILSSPVAFPYNLVPGETLIVSYVANLVSPGAGVNLATISASKGNSSYGFNAQASWNFENAQIQEIDKCAEVTDDKHGFLGTVCGNTQQNHFGYYHDVGPFDVCGNYTATNTATITANDSQVASSASHTIDVSVPCDGGCTLSIRYWRMHSEHGHKSFDVTWKKLPQGSDTLFFMSKRTYYEVLTTHKLDNVYFRLAKQYIATKLNFLKYTTFDKIKNAYNSATSIFNNLTPAQVSSLRENSAIRKQIRDLIKILRKYNRGKLGPPRCSMPQDECDSSESEDSE